MEDLLPVAIIGAGPYGLSIAAHLRACGIDFRIFGIPMRTWRARMPAGMFLKSEGFASNLYDPEGCLTLKRFCAEDGLAYGDCGKPVPLETLAAYGLAFHRRFVPQLEERRVVALDPSANGFRLRLDDGETFAARRAVVAVGLSYFQHLPECLAGSPAELVSHSADHRDLGGFKGRQVAVIGAGASALDLAGLLHEAGAEVSLVARRTAIAWTAPPLSPDRPLWQRIRYPISGMGPGLRSRLYEDAPMLFRYLPQTTRLRIVKTFLGPAPGWFMRDRVVGRVQLHLGTTLQRAEIRGGRIQLCLASGDGARHSMLIDHVIAATGYRTDLRRIPFFGAELRAPLRVVEDTPVLSSNFESSVPGLYFVGLASANTFGPVMRFMLGARSTARRLSMHLARPPARRLLSAGAGTVGPARA
jgi:hypothetical protein